MTGRAARAAARAVVGLGLLVALVAATVRLVGDWRAGDGAEPELGVGLVAPLPLLASLGGLLWWSAMATVAVGRARRHLRTMPLRRVEAPRVGELLGPVLVLATLATAAGVVAEHWSAGVMFLPVAGSLALWWAVEVVSAMAEVDRWCHTVLESGATLPGPDARLGTASHRQHHTVVPRAMVLAAHVALLSVPILLVLLERSGRATVEGWHVTPDLEARRLLTAIVVVAGTTHALGWLWWTVAAALNASRRVRWPVSPLLAPSAHVVGVVAGVTVLWSIDRVAAEHRVAVVVAGTAVALLAHLAVLAGYRRTAEAMGASVRFWTWAISSPWLAVTLTAVAAFATADVGNAATEFVLEAGWVLSYFVHALAVHAAMSSFDRECAGRRQVRVSDRTVAAFIATLRPSHGPTAHPGS